MNAPLAGSYVPSVLVWLATVFSVGPALLVASGPTLLDRYPYALGALAGSVLFYPFVWYRARRFPAGELEWVLSPLWLAPPSLGLALLAFGDVRLDRSPVVSHPTRLLAIEKCTKNGSCARLSSWRHEGEESVRLGGLGGLAVPWDLRPPAPVVVETQSGFFGFEHVTAIRAGASRIHH
ncbi:MAG TPA: hypothetical protein VHE30_00335 [Polyangiaceae bacterium]|nr:hypothetical protein [Polyangiaceae bacterium]